MGVIDGFNVAAMELKYAFKLAGGEVKEFLIKLDSDTLHLIKPDEAVRAPGIPWKEFRCHLCTLNKRRYSGCPVICNLMDLVENFKDAVSCDAVELVIETPRRNYFRRTTMQSALSSLMGIYMTTSGCPVLEKLKPMVRFHLPFASPEETAYRMITMYLMAQYFRQRKGKKADWQLENLADIFAEIVKVNQSVCAKLRALIHDDAILNALVKLNFMVGFISFRLDDNLLGEIERFFNAYLDER